MSSDMRVGQSGDNEVRQHNLLTVTNGLLVTTVALTAIAFSVGLLGLLASQGVNLGALNALFAPIPSYISASLSGFGGTLLIASSAVLITIGVYHVIHRKNTVPTSEIIREDQENTVPASEIIREDQENTVPASEIIREDQENIVPASEIIPEDQVGIGDPVVTSGAKETVPASADRSVSSSDEVPRHHEVYKGNVSIGQFITAPIAYDQRFKFGERLKDAEGNPVDIKYTDFYVLLKVDSSTLEFLKKVTDDCSTEYAHLPSCLFVGKDDGDTVDFSLDGKNVELTCSKTEKGNLSFKNTFINAQVRSRISDSGALYPEDLIRPEGVKTDIEQF